MRLSQGSPLGPYKILGDVGSGGMGEVYRAHDPRLGRDVALKILPTSMAADPEGLARFTREARAVAALNHPHIVTIYSTEESDGIRFMTMELIEGRTLDRLIPSSGMSLAQFFDIATALADALSAAHLKQITHRDLKPANIMLTDAGRVKVLDFGLARGAATTQAAASIDYELTRQGLTQTGTVLGTMPYMAPEQIEARDVDGRSDIFSLGIVMYEMATGMRPFAGDSSPALMSSILRDHPPSITQRRLDAPDGVAHLIARCLEKDPRDRVQTAQEVLIELRAQRRAWESGVSSLRSGQTAGTGPQSGSNVLRIGVLPFAARPSSGDVEALADGLTDDITVGLARFPILRVVSRQDAQRMSGHDASGRAAAQLDARYLVEGTVRAAGAAVRVSVRLVDTRTGTHLWAETFERSMSESLFALQDDVANRVIASIADSNGALVRSMASALRDKPLSEHTPLELVIRYEAYNQWHRREDHGPLLAAFEAIVDRHPGEAEAWACLAALIFHELGFGYNRQDNSLQRMREAVRRAMEIDSACQRAWLVAGMSSFIAHDLSGLRIATQRVIDINPLDTSKLAVSAIQLGGAGELDRAAELAKRAIALHTNVAPWYYFPLFTARYLAREYPEALEEAKRGFTETFTAAQIGLACAAGKTSSAVDTRAAFETYLRAQGRALTTDRVREHLSQWFWDDGVIDHFLEGFDAASALVATPQAATRPASSGRTPASSSSSMTPRSGSSMAPIVDRAFLTAVRPFSSRADDPEGASLAQGLSEDISTGLSRFQHFGTVGGDEVDARYCLDGSVRRSGDITRISVRLVGVDTGAHIWAENYDRRMSAAGLFDVQDEITARVVATVAGTGGVLVRAMATPLRQRPVEELSAHELVLRYCLYSTSPTPDEHARLRERLESLLAAQPAQALAWAALAALYDHEISLGLNPLPESAVRSTRAARRSVEADPACQLGWQRLIAASYFTSDWSGMQNAADRLLALNPLNQNATGFAGLVLAISGNWDRGVPMLQRAIDFDPYHLSILHIPLFLDHYRKREYDQALSEAKRVTAFETPLVGLSHASAAGQVGRLDEVRLAFEVLQRDRSGEPPTREWAHARWAVWLRDDELIERLLEGFDKARELIAAPRSQSIAVAKPPSGRSASIAVLPFMDMSPGKDQEWFCDGVAEEVLNALSQVKGLSVAARASAFSFRGKGDDLRAIGEKLHVTTVLDGSVRRAGDQVRITVRLSDVANNNQIWSERYDRNIDDIFNVQDEIARTIAERLRVTLGSDPASMPRVVRHTENQEAYHLYLRGRHHWYGRSKGALGKALEYFEQATKCDPDYALAYVGLADLYTAQGIYAYTPELEVAAKARAAVQKALAINDRLADTYRALGFIQLFFDWDPKAAEQTLLKAVELDPTSALSYAWLGWPAWPGRKEDALRAMRRAQELDPLNPYVNSLSGIVHDVWVSPEEGITQAMKALDLDPDYLVGLYLIGGAYTHQGRHDKAMASFSRAVDVSGRAPFFVSYLAWAQACAGRTAEARAGLAEIQSRSATEYVAPLHFAIVHAALGELDVAFARLEEAVRANCAWIGSPRISMFDGFRGDPRFAELLRRLGHPDADQRDLHA